MPYKNVPEHLWDDMDSCVKQVMAKQDLEKGRAIAICHTSIVGKDKSACIDWYIVMKREWTQKMRDDLASGKTRGEFAGPDQSFPIAGPEDVHAAYMSAGRAGGDPEAIRRAVIRIAKKFGWTSGLPQSVKDEMREKSSITLSGIITKAQKMPDGRVKWRARVNSGQFDQEGERFDHSYFEELVKNFAVQQEALSRSEQFPIQVKLDNDYTLTMNEPIQDIAHYSYFLPQNLRNKARTGYPVKLWLDGDALMSEGYFDNTKLGMLAAKATLAEKDVEKRRVSLGTYPDWGLVEEMSDGRRVFKGGRGRAWLDHEAITSYPVDADTEILTLSEVSDMPTQKEDALQVLGKEAEEEIEELEKAKVKSETEDVVLKTETKEEDKLEADVKSVAEEVVKSTVTRLLEALPDAIEGKIKAALSSIKLEELPKRLEEIETKLAALTVDETQKLKAALDSKDGDWLTEQLTRTFSVQHGDKTVVKGDGAPEPSPITEKAKLDSEWDMFQEPSSKS